LTIRAAHSRLREVRPRRSATCQYGDDTDVAAGLDATEAVDFVETIGGGFLDPNGHR